jgi:two-component system, NtrC family, sensor histidine kinase AtoS
MSSESSSASVQLLKGFTRLLAAGFDLPRTLEMFLDGVNEFLRPSRLALLLPDDDRQTYRVRVHRGLLPQIAEAVRLPVDRGLCHWLAVHGRPARAGDLADIHITRELALFQGTMAVPLLARGELVAVLVVGAPVVRPGYATHEVETLFDLATHLAGAIDGISLHHRLQHASEFNERILQHMSSGVITIGADEHVGIMNRRAAEILEMEASDVVGKDLRVLPSPLGDMLYETLSTGRARPREEIRLALRGLWLDVSTYAVRGDETIGAVLVFEDLTAQKELAARKREAEQFDLLGRVVARIADEIRNPLVSINTFMELIGERLDDPDFRRQFAGVVGRDVRRLVQVFEKLSGLVTRSELNFSTVDVHSVIDEAVTAVHVDEWARKTIDVKVARDADAILVKVDPAQCRKALGYLIWYLGHRSPDQAVVSVSVARHENGNGGDEVRIVVGSRTASVPAPEAEQLFDPVRVAQESVLDMGPAVSQRIVEALGGKLELRQGRHDLAFVVTLPVAA